jgi:hypothetical protein
MTITKTEILHTIQKRGYWIVMMRPMTFEKERIRTVEDCLAIVQRGQVSLRGWNYPHYHESGVSAGGISIGTDYVQCITDHKSYKEIWRMYQTGQFFHRFACVEDWWQQTESQNVLEILSTLYRITEIYLFASHISLSDIWDTKMSITIELWGMSNRKLITLDPRRDLNNTYESMTDPLEYKKEYSKSEIVADPALHALECVVWLFRRFNWRSPELKEILKKEQNKFINGDIPIY